MKTKWLVLLGCICACASLHHAPYLRHVSTNLPTLKFPIRHLNEASLKLYSAPNPADANENAKAIPQDPEKPSENAFEKAKLAVAGFFGGAKMDKKKIAELGTSALLSYGFVSNFSYTACTAMAWFTHAKRTGLSPLAPGQWPGFLAVYSGFFIAQNVLRPARFALSVAITPFFDKIVNGISKKFAISKPKAFGVTVFLVNFCGTLTLMATGVAVASWAAGVPIKG
mmetsp:Transcript_12062/g.17779  ORF Transcript_12062/g.17779 Transcript_12062/m.17779 type:complete len:226 (-) Transcript_12062:165-842(-)|eukprot:CAMPEP_0113943984 /NCGR_PEP_ID=MMETSP1339-20121228/30249_1 /TAXON_ID=94617 /ORGANISM="Fibrocapsa japonica" /LENGTH=225 /DNA_ID=CAMNT_0000949011 /DNA_START=83 /DNA_END=760 /DNA_ORIENTATION=+ /assembly_acc=CAM_ASM_000762